MSCVPPHYNRNGSRMVVVPTETIGSHPLVANVHYLKRFFDPRLRQMLIASNNNALLITAQDNKEFQVIAINVEFDRRDYSFFVRAFSENDLTRAFDQTDQDSRDGIFRRTGPFLSIPGAAIVHEHMTTKVLEVNATQGLGNVSVLVTLDIEAAVRAFVDAA